MCKGPYGKASNLVYILGFDNDSEELMHWNRDHWGSLNWVFSAEMLALVVIKHIPKALYWAIAVYWFAKVFSRIRYKSTVFWVAETKVRMGPLVLVGLDLVLGWGFSRARDRHRQAVTQLRLYYA